MIQENREKVYWLSGIALLLLAINLVRELPIPEEDISEYPDLSYTEILKLYTKLEAEVKTPLRDWEHYFQTNQEIEHLRRAAVKLSHKNRALQDPRIRDTGIAGAPLREIEESNIRRGNNFPEKYDGEIAKARESVLGTDYQTGHPTQDNTEQEKRFITSLALLHFGFMPFVWLIYAIRILDRGGSVALEMVSNPKFPIFLLVWQVGIFKYNATGIREQVRSLVRYASLLMTATLSFGTATLKAQTKKAEGEEQGAGGHTLVVSGSTHFLPKYLGLNGAVFHSGTVSQSSVTIAHKSGIYFNVWQSLGKQQGKDVPNFGVENDITVGHSGKLHGRSINASFTYFNVNPLSRLPTGDLLQESLLVSDLTPKITGSYLLLRNVHPIKNGVPKGGKFVHLGISRYFKLTKLLRLELGGEAVLDSGGFGFNRAGIARWSSVLKIPWKGITFDLPLVRMSAPFTGPRDGRKFESVIGFGLSFSH